MAASVRDRLSSVVVATALAALIVLGVLAVLIFAVRGAETSYSTAAMTVAVTDVAEDAINTTASLQEERALASILAYNALSAYHSGYRQAIEMTDAAIQDLRVEWSQNRTEVPETATPPISDVLAGEVSLAAFRDATVTPSGESTFDLYTELVGLSLSATSELIKQADDPATSTDRALIVALLNTSEALQSQRYLVQEGLDGLAAGEPMSEELLLRLDVVTNSLRQGLFEARSLAEDAQLEEVEEIMSGPAAAASEDLLAAIRADTAVDSGVSPEDWFATSSARIEQVTNLIPRVLGRESAVAQENLDRAQRSLWTRSILLGTLFILTILVASNAVYATRERGEALAEYGQLADGLREWFVAASFPDNENVAIAARYVPASVRTVSGGDWYDVYEVGDHLAIVIGDVAGHGAEATAQMAQLRNILRGQSTARPLGPADQIDLLSRTISDSGIVATLTYGLLDQVTGEFVYTRAGHIPLLIRSASGSVRIEEEAPGPPVGSGVELERHQETTLLQPGDVLILITDGLVERIDRDIDLALDQMAKTLTETEFSSDALLDRLFSINGEDPIDDAAALLITWKPDQVT
ncbi:MAG: PP2C family protein-serine/threonine phosphatase [Acidimicrobiia bacterium]